MFFQQKRFFLTALMLYPHCQTTPGEHRGGLSSELSGHDPGHSSDAGRLSWPCLLSPGIPPPPPSHLTLPLAAAGVRLLLLHPGHLWEDCPRLGGGGWPGGRHTGCVLTLPSCRRPSDCYCRQTRPPSGAGTGEAALPTTWPRLMARSVCWGRSSRSRLRR